MKDAMKIAVVKNVLVYDGTASNSNPDMRFDYSIGTVYTMVATGTAGQTVKLQGSIDNEHWVDIVTFTIEADTDVLSSVQQFSYAYLQVTGDATLKIAKGQ
ncbi:hypothetical protein [Acinetobacter sp. CFCC 10889]|uniref:hypothetical protein n=1 Tax=Acinetobacter sp. CFCC 10889 TaxID=1775557 RepID=UPI000DCFFD0B|nr:hypothetical protein [Acinetobacter sp. CFCC 10889]